MSGKNVQKFDLSAEARCAKIREGPQGVALVTPLVLYFIAHEKGFKCHAQPQTGAYSCSLDQLLLPTT